MFHDNRSNKHQKCIQSLHGNGLEIIAGITSAIAAIYCTYWDLVVDWGLLQRHSNNRWLRDKLLVPCKTVYFAAMVLDVLLRLAWLQTVLDLKLDFLHEETVITSYFCRLGDYSAWNLEYLQVRERVFEQR
ncbi:hypothetical protein Dsin_012055 [Dipteronia sinensis]|uniref:EXS domain-containing protein n=1 Tax=Dipteronia sinensis TaxID=43782 RepID=A0AAE0AI78_9ROSI|nr:hypothetical protein Dsin_012055 [Dipteronia sinensis]